VNNEGDVEDILSKLECSHDEIVQFNNNNWECASLSSVFDGITCAD